jgi:hypothetical protein
MTRFNLLATAAILSAAIATPVSAQQAVQEPGAQAFYRSLGVQSLGVGSALPTYEANGLPISPVQAGLLGAANVREQSPTAATASPHQVQVLTPRPKLKTATAASARRAE